MASYYSYDFKQFVMLLGSESELTNFRNWIKINFSWQVACHSFVLLQMSVRECDIIMIIFISNDLVIKLLISVRFQLGVVNKDIYVQFFYISFYQILHI